MLKLRTSISALAIAAATAMTFGSVLPAEATEGYMPPGFGARSKALAGAGVADSRDATAASLNPAGLVHVGDEITMSVSAFNPNRSFSTDGPGVLIGGSIDVDSDKPWFFVPNLAWSTRSLANPLFDVMALSVVGNGGMNTSYPSFTNDSNFCRTAPQPAGGAFCFGKTGINLLQMVMSVAMAKQIAPGISVGVAPMMALQSIDAHGTDMFGGFSTTGKVSGNLNDWSVGGGVRAGIEISPMRNVRLGVSGTTPIWMQDFEKYDGLFAQGGGFDVPATLQAGIAVDVTPALTLMLDWRYIWYSSVDSIGNPMGNIMGCPNLGLGGTDPRSCLGGANGPGFGWNDINVIKFGAEYRANEKLTLRAGYAWNEQPINKADVTFNILAPASTQHHITGGLEYDLGGGYHLELAALYAPNVSVRGPEFFNAAMGGGPQNVKLEMHQYEVTVGVKYKFDEAAAPLK